MWIDIAEVVPAWTCPLWHRIRLTTTFDTIFTSHFKPVCQVSQWAFTSTWRADILGYWQDKWQVTFWNSCWSAIFPMNDWDWFTPVTLTTKEPVTKTVSDFFLTKSFFFQPSHDFGNRFFFVKTVQEVRVDVKAVFCVSSLFNVATFKHFYNWKIKLFSKFPVTFIVCRYGHNSTCSVASKNIVGNPDWNFFTIDRVDSISTSPNPCFFLGKVCTSQVWFKASLVFVVRYSLSLFRCRDGIY